MKKRSESLMNIHALEKTNKIHKKWDISLMNIDATAKSMNICENLSLIVDENECHKKIDENR